MVAAAANVKTTKKSAVSSRRVNPIARLTPEELAKLAPPERPKVFCPSIEGAQHGALDVRYFFDAVAKAGAAHVQLSNYQLHRKGVKGWKLHKPQDVKDLADSHGVILGGSAHCPIYMATGGLQVFPGETLPFHHPAFKGMGKALRNLGPGRLVREYLPRLFDFYAATDTKAIAMFWGPLWDPQERKQHGAVTGNLDSRYPWPFFNKEQLGRAIENFVRISTPILDMAKERGLVLAHEAHPKTAAWTPAEWAILKKALGGHPAALLNADPSHGWNGQSARDMFGSPEMRDDVIIAHFKDHVLIQGKPLLTWLADWKDRGMQFCPLGEGVIDLHDFARLLIEIGAVSRYFKLTGQRSFPAVCEAEAVYSDGLETGLHGIRWLKKEICWYSAPAGSFEDGMGDSGAATPGKKKK